MAILSLQELFSNDQAITASAPSTNHYARTEPGSWVRSGGRAIIDDMGNAYIPMFFQVTETFDNLTSLQVIVEQDDDEAFGSATEVHSETFTLAQLTAGAKYKVRMIPHDTVERFLRFRYVVTGTAPTAGKVTAGLSTKQEDSWGTR